MMGKAIHILLSDGAHAKLRHAAVGGPSLSRVGRALLAAWLANDPQAAKLVAKYDAQGEAMRVEGEK